MSFLARVRLVFNELGCDRHGSKPLRRSGSGADDACVDPSHHGAHQNDVSDPLILRHSRAVQADFSRDNA